MEQLLAHLWGDYIMQSDWMANNKTSKSIACFFHAIIYTWLFLFLTDSILALMLIGGSHFVIDRWRLAKYVVYAKNLSLAPQVEIWKQNPAEQQFGDMDELKEKWSWENCQATGYPSETPAFLAVWLLIIADNTLHLTINYLALKYL